MKTKAELTAEYCAAVTRSCDAQETYERAAAEYCAANVAERAAFQALCAFDRAHMGGTNA